jgi:hypothetical protein
VCAYVSSISVDAGVSVFGIWLIPSSVLVLDGGLKLSDPLRILYEGGIRPFSSFSSVNSLEHTPEVNCAQWPMDGKRGIVVCFVVRRREGLAESDKQARTVHAIEMMGES